MKTSASLRENDAWISDGEEAELSGILISLMQLSFAQLNLQNALDTSSLQEEGTQRAHWCTKGIFVSVTWAEFTRISVHVIINLCLMIAIEAQYDSVPNAALANVCC